MEVMDLITVTQASQRHGLSGRWIRMLIEEGRIEGQSFGKTWVLDSNALATYIQNRRAPGRPLKKVKQ